MTEAPEETCQCEAGVREISPSLYGCPACGRIWGRVNGQWVEETGRVFKVGGATVNESAPRLMPDGTIVVDRAVEMAVPLDYIPFSFVVPDKEKL